MPRASSTLCGLGYALIGALVACTGPNPSYRTGLQARGPAGDAGDASTGDGPDPRSDAARADALEKVTTADSAPSADATGSDQARLFAARLVGYWKLDEAAGATVAMDSSGNGNHGALESLDGAQAWVTGRFGNAIQFGASESGEAGIRVPLSASVAGVREFTIAAWVNHGAVPVGQNSSVVSRQIDATTWEIFNLSTTGDELVVYACTDLQPYPRVRVPGAAPFAQWVHVAATYDGAHLRLYRDGQEIGSTALTRALPSADNPLYIGTNKNPTRNDVFVGLIDEVVLYAAALPATSIRALMDGADPATL